MELTPAEIEMISIKREKEELEKKEKDLKIKLELQKSICESEEYIVRVQKKDKEQVEKTKQFAKQLGEGWEIKLTQRTETQTVYSPGGFEKENVFWCKEFERVIATIVKDDCKVEVQEHFVRENKYSRNTTNKGYKMFLTCGYIPGQSYVRASKVNEIVNDRIDQRELKEQYENRKREARDSAITKTETLFPTAGVEHKHVHRYHHGKNGRMVDILEITFDNGVFQEYEIYTNGELNLLSTKFPIGGLDLMDVVSKMVFQKDEKVVA